MSIKQVPIGEIANFINGYAFKPKDWEESGYKIIRIQNLTNSAKAYNHSNKEIASKYIVKKGDILVAWSATIGVFEWKGEDAYLNQHIFKVEFDSTKVNKNYFKLALNKTIDELSRLAHGATMKHITKKKFDKHKIPLPNIKDQQKIAQLLIQIESLIAKRQESIRLIDELIKSTFLEMFLQSDNQRDTYPLEDYLNFMTSGSRGWAKYYSDEGALFLRIQNIKDSKLLLDDTIRVNLPSKVEGSRTRVRENDLLMSITADLGRTAVVPKDFEEAYINQHLALLRLKLDMINPIFLSHYFSTEFAKIQVQKFNKGGAKAGLNFSDIKKIKILVPPKPLQDKFANRVTQIEKTKATYQKSLEELQKLFGSLSQRAFKGELDVDGIDVSSY